MEGRSPGKIETFGVQQYGLLPDDNLEFWLHIRMTHLVFCCLYPLHEFLFSCER